MLRHRMLFGELQHAEATPARKAARLLLKRYAERLMRKLEEAKAAGEVAADTDTQAAAILFIGTIQGLVMQSLLSGKIEGARQHAAGALRIYLRGLRAHPSTARAPSRSKPGADRPQQ